MDYKLESGKPIFEQITERIKHEIACGGYTEGDRVPSVRDLAISFGVNPNTVQRALCVLEQDGLIFTKRGEGRFVGQCNGDDLRESILIEKTRAYLFEAKKLGYDFEQIIGIIKKEENKE